MAATLKNSLYICTVKSLRRHEVAAGSSVFCALFLFVYYNRIECGSSNAHRVSAFENLTARNALSLCQISKV